MDALGKEAPNADASAQHALQMPHHFLWHVFNNTMTYNTLAMATSELGSQSAAGQSPQRQQLIDRPVHEHDEQAAELNLHGGRLGIVPGASLGKELEKELRRRRKRHRLGQELTQLWRPKSGRSGVRV
jgi:hypothetical protein